MSEYEFCQLQKKDCGDHISLDPEKSSFSSFQTVFKYVYNARWLPQKVSADCQLWIYIQMLYLSLFVLIKIIICTNYSVLSVCWKWFLASCVLVARMWVCDIHRNACVVCIERVKTLWLPPTLSQTHNTRNQKLHRHFRISGACCNQQAFFSNRSFFPEHMSSNKDAT